MRTFFIALLLFLPSFAFAAGIEITRPSMPVHTGDTFLLTVTLKTDTDAVNAVEGTIELPVHIKLSSVRLSGSVVPLWVTAPEEKSPGKISFAGVLPGGFQGTGVLFSLAVTAQEAGTFNVALAPDVKAYSNDGNGTEVKLTARALSFAVEKSAGAPSSASIPKDALPPEPFVPQFASGEAFGIPGTVLVFATQDKDSGVMRYEVAHSYNSFADEKNLSWSQTESPYALTKDDAGRYVFVRATDYEGNFRVAKVSPPHFSPLAFVATWWIPLLVFIVLAVILSMRFLKRR